MFELIIPTFNNPTYFKKFITQIDNYDFTKIEILDNNSEYRPMVELLNQLQEQENITIKKLKANYGPHYALRNPEIYASLDQVFCLSDSDIEFSKTLPEDFLKTLFDISEEYKIGKVGFAIAIPELEDLTTPFVFMDGKLKNIQIWEEQFWREIVGRTKYDDPIYKATIDTTFALYNKKYFDPNDRYTAFRVAGNFTSRDLGFSHDKYVDEDELKFYKEKSRYSYFSGNYDTYGNPVVQLSVLEYTRMVEKLESLERDILRLAFERDNLNLNLTKLYGSRSWQLTKPLRSILKVFRKDN